MRELPRVQFSSRWKWVRSAALAAFATACLLAPPSAAQECPTAQTAAHGFVVERNVSQKSEVYDTGQGLVHVVTRYAGETVLESTQYAGLFFIERVDRGRRTKYEPRTDLETLFPLKPGAQLQAKFITERDGNFGRLYVELDVGKIEDLLIGPCKYAVLRIERRESSSALPPQFVYTDLYSPDLKFVFAREYRRQGGQTQLIKYDRIYPLKN
ncbi:MAG TPA: hypothetical protein VKX28_15705 [Xanthobacteraceae bacterium]|nr:hypothetical protein [Xanthobacteraceae bacterium]